MNKRYIKPILVFTLLISGLAVISVAPTTQAQTDPTPVKLGLLAPLTGDLSFLGVTFLPSFNLAIDDLNAMYDNFTFSGIAQDTQTDPTQAAAGITSLASSGVVGVVGAAGSGNTLAAMQVAKANEIPMISYASTSPTLTDADDGDFLFRVVPSDAFQGPGIAEVAYNDGVTQAAIIHLSNAYGQGLADAFTDSFENDYNQSVSLTLSYPDGQEDFTSIANSVQQGIESSTVDGIILISYNVDGAAILDDLATAGVSDTLPIFGGDGAKAEEIFTATTSDHYIGVKGTAPLAENNTEFYEKYFNETGYGPRVYVAETYDATMILGHAAAKLANPTGCRVADNIREVTEGGYGGVSGTIEFDAHGDRTTATYEVWEAFANETIGTIDTFSPTVPSSEGHDVVTDHCGAGGDDDTDGDGAPFNLMYFFLGFLAIAVVVPKYANKK